jgi:hypothetical protein
VRELESVILSPPLLAGEESPQSLFPAIHWRWIMRRRLGCFVVVLLLLSTPSAGKRKEEKLDPRLKQIHTIFLKGAFVATQEVRRGQAEIEKGSCLKLTDRPETADAIVNVSYTPGGVSQVSKGQWDLPGMGIPKVEPYHTALELSVREGAKLRKIWQKHADLDKGQQDTRAGVLRLMDLLRDDACSGRR